MEHERLRHRLTELRSQLPPRTSASPPSIPTTSAIYATSTIPSQGLIPVTGPYSKSLDHSRYALPSANYEDIVSASRDVLEGANYGVGSLYNSSAHPDEESDEGVKKKKVWFLMAFGNLVLSFQPYSSKNHILQSNMSVLHVVVQIRRNGGK